MKIEYYPPENRLDVAGLSKYYAKYVEPLGRARSSVLLTNSEMLLESDRPGLLSLTNRFVDIAFGLFSSYTMEEVEEWGQGNWYGDLEPRSPAFTIVRDGLPLRFSDGFVYEPPPYNGAGSTLEPISKLAIGVEGDIEGIYSLYLKSDATSLISLAKHFVYLSQADVRIGESLNYRPTYEFNSRISRLKIVLTRFPQDVPWAKRPDSKETSNRT